MVIKVKGDAEMDLNGLGVAVDGEMCFDFDSKLVRRIVNSNEEEIVDDCEECEPLSSDNEDEDEHDRHDMDVLRTFNDADFLEFCTWQSKSSQERPNSEQSCTSIESTAFVQIPYTSGNILRLSKQFDCMVFREGVRRLSNDRNLRVRHNARCVECAKLIVKIVERRKIRIGDWIVFKTEPKEKEIAEKFLLGRVMSLSLLKGTKKEMAEVLWEWDEDTKDVGVLCHWYICERKEKELTGNVDQIEVFSHRFYPCRNDTLIYVAFRHHIMKMNTS
ncbi:hypothetical protein GHT06_017083 [Daphnia sinensis]|uniref:BAH domain-containing protein n=1 Tax=Daphnia sinensis TaxID=1820382 RepID=A0AAD5L6V0_9CRUS|nr:hypothetical protein GHT06_017083 [Daphnia sinensis]